MYAFSQFSNLAFFWCYSFIQCFDCIQIVYDKQEEELEEKETEEEKPLLDEDWEPDERAVTDLQGYRIHVWDSTILGNVK